MTSHTTRLSSSIAPSSAPPSRVAGHVTSSIDTAPQFHERAVLPHLGHAVRYVEWHGAHLAPHLDHELEILLVERPGLHLRHHARLHRPAPGSLCLVNAGELHALSAIDGRAHVVRALHIELDYLATVLPEGAGMSNRSSTVRPSFCRTVVQEPEAFAALAALLDALDETVSETDREFRVITTVTQLWMRHGWHAGTVAAVPARTIPGVRRVREFLADDLTANASLDELATLAGLSKYYLLRAFARAYGLPPHAYHMELRLARARQLLRQGQAASRIAYDCGFSDQSHLTRRFKRYCDLTPGAYARLASRSAVPRVAEARSGANPPAVAGPRRAGHRAA